MMPHTDGQRIVYVQDGALHIFDTATGNDERLRVECATDHWLRRPRLINPRDYIHAMNVGNDGKTVLLEARGDVFVLDPTGADREPFGDAGNAEVHPQLSPDGRLLLTGRATTNSTSRRFRENGPAHDEPRPDGLPAGMVPDGKKILSATRISRFHVDVATKKIVAVDASNQMKNDEFFWEVSDYGWSPDSNWVCYSFVQYNRNSQVFLFHLPTGKRYAVTDDFYDNLNPCFDANGKYLYYLSSRDFTIQMDFYEDNHVVATPQQVMVVQLQAGEKPPFLGRPAGEKKDEAAAGQPLRIDLDGLKDRTYPLPVPAGNYFFLRAGKGKALWSAVDKFTEDEYEEIFKPGGRAKWNLHIFDMAERKEAVLGEKVSDFGLAANGEHLIIRKGNDFTTSSVAKAFASKALGERVNLQGMLYRVDPLAEWNQIFNDAWRWYRDFFYDAGFHGRDWKALGDAYRARIPFLSSRSQLNWLLQQLVGELSVSHTISGGT
jgi:tricorn protease